MGINEFKKDEVIFSLDIGTRSVIGTVGIVREKKLEIICEHYIEHEERAMMDGQIHDIQLVAQAVYCVKSKLEQELGFNLTHVSIAAAGRFLRTSTAMLELEFDSSIEISKDILRSLELTAVKKAESEVINAKKGKLYCVGHSVKNYYLNGFAILNLLSHKGDSIGAEVIATFLPRSVIDSLYAVMEKVGLIVASLTLEPIAAIEAVIPQNLRLLNLALVDIGAGTSDIAISSKDSIAAYGMVPLAGDEITESIAQALLVDFNTAERIKRQCGIKEKIVYVDVLGLENEIESSEVQRIAAPMVEKVAEEIAKAILELNGGKTTNAVFLVGGGAYTIGLKEVLAAKLNLSPQRIAIKGREAVTDCIYQNMEMGSVGVTVLGIALAAIKRLGNDFINVKLNDTMISLFNSHKHTVMDVLMQAGINPKLLIGKNGKNLHFTLNGVKRIAFGGFARNAVIKLNGSECDLESEVYEGDGIELIYAQDGHESEPKPFEYLLHTYSISFFFDQKLYNLEPICFINTCKASLMDSIKDKDDVRIIYPSTIKDFIQFNFEDKRIHESFYLYDKAVDLDYNIKEGDKIYSGLEVKVTEKGSYKFQSESKSIGVSHINVYVNGKDLVLKGKKSYVFIDVFSYINFDLSAPKGNIVLKLNGVKTGYYDKLKEGDIIDIYWE